MDQTLPRPVTITEMVENITRQKGDQTAIVYLGQHITFNELLERSQRVADGLRRLGIGEGDRVSLWLPAVPAWLITYIALCRLGAVAVATNTKFRSSEVQDIVSRSQAKAIIMWPGFKHIDFEGILSDIDPTALTALQTVILYSEDKTEPAHHILGRNTVSYHALEQSPPYTADHATPESGCNIFTTSGTTKAPKLVYHKQSATAGHLYDINRAFGLDQPGKSVLHMIPFCGVWGFDQGMMTLAGGSTLYIMPFFNPAEAARLIQAHRITHTSASDEAVRCLLEVNDTPVPFPSLELIGFAAVGGGSSQDLVLEATRRGLTLRGLYGSSELGALFSLQSDTLAPEDRTQGGGICVNPETQVRTRDKQSGNILPHGERGEIEIKTPSRMVGYLNNPEATQTAFTEDGFFKTGDLGYTRDDGSWVFLSRLGDAIRLSGFLVSPAEIEGYIETHPAVSEAQVVGVQQARKIWLCAFIIPADANKLDNQLLRQYCEKGMAKYKVPQHFEPIDAFPVTLSANGNKIQRAKLRDMAESIMRRSLAPAT